MTSVGSTKVTQDDVATSPAHYHLTGFGSLADFVSSDADRSAAIYRRFDKLAARDLHYYQSELARLEALQDEYDIEDARDARDARNTDLWGPLRDHAQDWEIFSQGSATRPDSKTTTQGPNLSNSPSVVDPEGDRWRRRRELAMEIRKTLREYREMLIQESTLLALNQPTRQTMTAMSNYFHGVASASGEATYPALAGVSSNLYPQGMTSSQIKSSDYISLSQQPATDLLTTFLTTYCSSLLPTSAPTPPPPLLPQYHPRPTISHLPRQQVTHYSMQLVAGVTTFITTLLAAVLLFLPIFTLYHVSHKGPALTLGLIALFTLLFAGATAILTNARKAEVFGACAAYAAVLVVFVSGDFAAGKAG